jgi:hypothetical protein
MKSPAIFAVALLAAALLAGCEPPNPGALPSKPAPPQAPSAPSASAPAAPAPQAPSAPSAPTPGASVPPASASAPGRAAPQAGADAPPPAPKDPDLLAHWKLDEKSGTSAEDSSGHRHAAVLQQGGTWGEGRIGGAITFDGKGGHLEVPSSPDLDRVNQSSYTISAWFKPADIPPGKESANNAAYGIVNKTGWHEGLRFNDEGKFVMEHWLAGDPPVWTGAGTWETTYAAGEWRHVVGVVDVQARQIRLYVDGELANTGEEWEAGKKARDYESTTWKIGIGAPGSEEWSWPAKGSIDDVRIYKRALSDADVGKLFKEAKK